MADPKDSAPPGPPDLGAMARAMTLPAKAALDASGEMPRFHPIELMISMAAKRGALTRGGAECRDSTPDCTEPLSWMLSC